MRYAGTKKETYLGFAISRLFAVSNWSNFEKWQTNYERLSKFPEFHPYMKANTKYVDISKWTTIMSRRNAGPLLEYFDHLLKVIIMMTAYEVPP